MPYHFIYRKSKNEFERVENEKEIPTEVFYTIVSMHEQFYDDFKAKKVLEFIDNVIRISEFTKEFDLHDELYDIAECSRLILHSDKYTAIIYGDDLHMALISNSDIGAFIHIDERHLHELKKRLGNTNISLKYKGDFYDFEILLFGYHHYTEKLRGLSPYYIGLAYNGIIVVFLDAHLSMEILAYRKD